MALDGPVAHHATEILSPLRDLFAAPLAAAYVLITVVTGPALARLPDYPWFKAFVRRRTATPRQSHGGAAAERG
jgi:hypothetical protein